MAEFLWRDKVLLLISPTKSVPIPCTTPPKVCILYSMKNKQHGRGAAVTVAVVAVSVLAVALFIIVANCIQPFMIDNDNIYLKTVVSGGMPGKAGVQLC